MPNVFITLSTYNGGPYLRPLVESICRQSYSEWTLLVRDDGSSDDTVQLVREAATRDPRIVLLEPDGQRLGPYASFGLLMQRAYDRAADYLLLADQDDVWHADKVERMLTQIRREEAAFNPPSPLLVYSDLAVVDAELRPVHPSFLQHARLRHSEGQPLRTLLGRCFVLGCASIVNRPLLDFALPLPETVASHDWWLALCAAAVGRISFLPQPTIDYRRHAQNTSGPADFWKGFNPWRHSWRRRWQVGFASFNRSIAQARALRDRLAANHPDTAPQALELLRRFCQVFDQPHSGWQRVRKLRRLATPDIDLPRRLLYDLCVLRLPRTAELRQPDANTPAD